MKTFTMQNMKDFSNYICECENIDAAELFEEWYKERFKPTKKVIDLSVLIDSQIDCTHDLLEGYGPLDDSWTEESLCEARVVPRTKYIHAWQGGECPLPEGFMVKVWFRNDGDYPRTVESHYLEWRHLDVMDIIAFEVLGLADGYVMPWESEK